MSGKGIHLPNPSYWPLVTAHRRADDSSGASLAFPTLGPWVSIAGVAILFFGIFRWAFEPAG